MAGTRRWIAIGCGALIGVPLVLCAGVGAWGGTLDGHVEVATEAVLPASTGAIFDLLDDADGLRRWWTIAMASEGMGPPTVTTPPGAPAAGMGAVVVIAAPGMPSETWTITELDPVASVGYDVDFWLMVVHRRLTLAQEGDGTRVRWTDSADVSNPWVRPMLQGDHTDLVGELQGALQALGRAAQEAPAP